MRGFIASNCNAKFFDRDFKYVLAFGFWVTEIIVSREFVMCQNCDMLLKILVAA